MGEDNLTTLIVKAGLGEEIAEAVVQDVLTEAVQVAVVEEVIGPIASIIP